jgi:RNA polymerase sigma-70 factor, ECF subfamily
VTDEARSRSILRISEQRTSRKPSPVFSANTRRAGADASRSSRHNTQAKASKRAAALRQTAFEEMFVASRRGFLAIARMILRNREDAEDAVQNAFLSGRLNLHNFEERSALKTWFTRIVVNSALMLRRKRKRFATDPQQANSARPEDEWTDSIPASQPDPESILADREVVDLVQSALGKMKPLLRQAFTMTYFEGLTTREGSVAQGVPCETFKARLFRAKRRVLQQTGRALASPLCKSALKASPRQGIMSCAAERSNNDAISI